MNNAVKVIVAIGVVWLALQLFDGYAIPAGLGSFLAWILWGRKEEKPSN